jgi:multidrug efflux pump subunit AcrA (membrane-fusion protein)
MRAPRRSLAAVLVAVGIAVSGCGSTSTPAMPAAGKLVHVAGSPGGHVVLTPSGAQRLGVETATVRATRAHGASGPSLLVPYSSLVYDPNGNTYVFISLSALTFAEVPVSVGQISGDSVYLLRGPAAGARVVTVGAEELYGVQTGVLEQA